MDTVVVAVIIAAGTVCSSAPVRLFDAVMIRDSNDPQNTGWRTSTQVDKLFISCTFTYSTWLH